MRSNWSVLSTIKKIFSRDIIHCPCTLKKTGFEKDMSIQSFAIIIILVLGLPLGNPREK
jgi:hypothetical protein